MTNEATPQQLAAAVDEVAGQLEKMARMVRELKFDRLDWRRTADRRATPRFSWQPPLGFDTVGVDLTIEAEGPGGLSLELRAYLPNQKP